MSKKKKEVKKNLNLTEVKTLEGLTKKLRSCLLSVTTSSVNKRKELFENDLMQCLHSPELQDGHLKGIAKIVLLTLTRYRDASSRTVVSEFIDELLTSRGLSAAKYLLGEIHVAAMELAKYQPSICYVLTSLGLLRWCDKIITFYVEKDLQDDSLFQKIVEVEVLCYSVTCSVKSVRAVRVRRMICTLLSRLGLHKHKTAELYIKFLDVILNNDNQQIESLGTIGFIFQQLTILKSTSIVDAPKKKRLIDLFVRNCIQVKIRTPTYILENIRPFLKYVSHEDFVELVPIIQKGLLRNPEVILEAVGYLLIGLSIDLSKYMGDLSKCICSLLVSQNVILHPDAIMVVKNLAVQCSDESAIEMLLKHLFKILTGSEGKLAMAEQRVTVLSAIAGVAKTTVSGAHKEKLASVAYDGLTSFLIQEGNEGVLLQGLTALSLWSAYFVSNLPSTFCDTIKKGISLKSASSAVKAGYFKVVAEAIKGNTVLQGLDLLDTLLQVVEKAKSQGHLVTAIYEAVTAATVIAQMAISDDIKGSKLGPFWHTALDPHKGYLVPEKCLAIAPKDYLQQLCKFLHIIVHHHFFHVVEIKGLRCWYHALIVLLLRGDVQVRAKTKTLIRKISNLEDVDRYEFFMKLSEVLLHKMDNFHVPSEHNDAQQHTLKEISHAYLAISGCIHERKNPLTTHEQLVMCCLCSHVHHPLLVDNGFNLLKRGICMAFVDIILEQEELHKMHINILKQTVVGKMQASDYLPSFMNKIIEYLSDPALKDISEEEYGILNTKKGEVYDQSVYESAKAAQTKDANVKRESKAYSFKEQKEEMELREELKKKKGQETEEKRPELNKKQKEQLHAIMAHEKKIRERLTILNEGFVKYAKLLSVLLELPREEIIPYASKLKDILQNLLNSRLASPLAVELYIKLIKCCFHPEYKHLGEFVGYTMLRHKKVACALPSNWCEIKLDAVTERVLNILNVFVTERNVFVMFTYTWKRPFSAVEFSFFLPLLEVILKDRGSIVHYNEQARMTALQLIFAHAKLRGTEDSIDDRPSYLPRDKMLSILSEVITSCDGHRKDGKIQHFANTVFDEVCKAGSGGEGCAVATVPEVELLLTNILSQCSVLRNASLKGLLELVDVLSDLDATVLNTLTRRMIIARYDMIEENAKLAEIFWEKASLKVTPVMTCELVDDTVHPLGEVRLAASKGLATALGEQQDLAGDVMTMLLATYEDKTKIPPPVIDNLGRNVSPLFIDTWEARQGVGIALEKISQYIPEDQLDSLFHFFVPNALGDRHDAVRKQMLDAAMQAVNHFGQDHMDMLLSIFQEFLDKAMDSSAHDSIRQSVIILTGSLAKHLAKTDPQVKPIFSKLMAALATPSQQVQQAVANCLPPLCGAMKDEAPELIKNLLTQLVDAESYGERRGAAYGLAGLVKGLGILSLKQQGIITTLNESIQDKKIWKHREGALLAFETLCTMLGRLFEPYVVHLLPHLLLCFGDGNQYVREAADETAKAVMKNLSNHGVKLVLPSLLKALEEEAWRTKTGSAELLGAMSFCAPKQLSSCLPNIVPRLTEVLADSHIKVQKAGQQALRQIGGVIRNPEIQEICPIILDALSDPSNHTVACLQALLSTSFVHFIDAPSLALIMPTLEKALDQRAMETKKMAAQILGNMYALTDPKDLSPYLPAVVPGLKKSLLDPSPEVRAVSARALGAIVRGMGEDCFNDLMPWLLETLTSDVSSVDRSGAAQGLAEVLHALGQERLDKLMPDVIDTTMKVELSPNVRDGYLMLYIYLPATFGDDFMAYIDLIIPPILKGLADESEYVRDTSLKAGQRIINMYSDSAIELLLPQLEAGLFDEHWRIRYSSVQLLGDLLFRLSGVTGKQTTVGDEDDNFGTSHSSQVILETLGFERRNRVYAGLYMGRSDVALTVRQAALHVWKVIVQNTAKTLQEILPTLFELLLSCLACQSYDKRQVAARTLGDLVRKLGERILPKIIPILEAGLDHKDGDKRQGVCIGLSEIMDSTSREMISQFEDSLISTVRRALVDELADVRHAASLTFENLHSTIGHRALDGVLPNVFEKLDDPNLSEFALDGLKQVMAVKSKSVLPFLVPKLTTPPVNTKALAILSSVAGDALVKHLEKILPAMIQAVNNESGDDSKQEAFEGTKTLILSVDDDGARTIVEELMSAAKNQNPGIRKVCANLLAVFCKDTRSDYSQFVQSLFRCIIQLMNDVDENVVPAGWSALDALVKHLDPAEQLQHLPSLRQALKFIKDDIRNDQLPGFCIPKKGIIPVLPIFREGILNGPQEIKEQASNVLGEVIRLTSAEALKPSVVHITGPLIRILGDRFNWNVKVAILDTLGLLLSKVGIMLKPFLPQLQTTFIKALNDQTLAVRQKAAWALGLLTVLHTRVDSLFTELRNGLKNNEDNAIRETILQALRTIILNAGAKMGEAIRALLLETLLELLDSTKDEVRVNAGAALGALCQVLSEAEVKTLLKDSLLDINPTMDWTVCHGRAVALSYGLFDAPSKLFSVVDEDEIVDVVVQHSNNDKVPVCTYGVHSLGHLLMFSKEMADAAPSVVVTSMKKNLVHTSVDIKLSALKTIKHVSKHVPEVLEFDRVRYVIPEFISLLRDRNTAVRALAELTLAFMLQLHKNDTLFDECVSTMTDAANFLQEYRKNSFAKLSDSIATDADDYIFST